MPDRPTFYVTTAIAYPNGNPHIGFAYEVIATDALARFKRLDGFDTFFLTGVDEHGLKMQQKAEEEGLATQELADRNTAAFIRMGEVFNSSHDDYIRTTEQRHAVSVQDIWRKWDANGDVYLDTYAGWYSVRDEAFYTEDETRLNADGVRVGAQGTPVEWTEEETFFFRLSSYQDRLLAHYEANPDFIQPAERRNEVISFMKGGLKDLSISRTTFDWGIPVPDATGHVMYVWADALTNYVTGVGYPDRECESFKKFWPADVHMIGKDILRFHAVYWPAFLMSAGLDLPKKVFAHGFLFNKGEKMSKSLGNVVDPFVLADQYGVDPLRYFLMREIPFGQDGNYSHEAIVNRINADLSNDLGNLAQRSLSMIAKNCEGRMPEPGPLNDDDKALLATVDGLIDTARRTMNDIAIHRTLEAIWAAIADANRYFAGQEPWALKKTDPARMGTVLYVTAEVIRQVAILVQPFMPESAGKLLDLVAVDESDRTFASLGETGRLAAGIALPKPAGVFPRYVEPEDAA
ncbi:MAG: methionine--tRNA ligase [Hyphomicrobiaceae bacterium]